MDEFATAFRDADSLRVLDIYAASEPPIEGITADALVTHIREVSGQEAVYAPSFSEAVDAVTSIAQEGDMVLTLGAGNVSQLGALVLEKLAVHTPLAASTI
jgi:UDP-N-acetylmuramate--alanine ligase